MQCFFFLFQLHYLELLKLRFGESHLHYCEVMLKDVADSRRINANIHSKMKMSEKNVLKMHVLVVDCGAIVIRNVFV